MERSVLEGVGTVNVSEESGADECGRAEGVPGPVPEGLPEGALEGLEGTISGSPIFQGLSETIYYTVTQG